MTVTEGDIRRVEVDNGFNLRDFGGYAVQGGGTVRRGMLFRSGTMALLSEKDEEHLRTLGIRGICDFRRKDERLAEPTRWHQPAGIDLWAWDHELKSGVLAEILKTDFASGDKVRAAMIEIYREIPIDHAPSYSAMLARLAEGCAPMLINCSAGKDRTGVGAAIILSLLGVARQDIFSDYLLTNILVDWGAIFGTRDTRLGRAYRERPDAIRPMIEADAAYLDAFFALVEERWGGMEGYAEQELNIGAAALERIRALLIEQ